MSRARDLASLGTSFSGTEDNVSLGENALDSITTGTNNVALGEDAGTALTTGSDNVAIGHSALKTEDGNGRNTAVGFESLLTLNAGADGENVAVGYRAGKALTEGIQNTLVGVQAGDALTHADYNVAVGRNALSNDTQGHRSTAIGFSALNTQNFTSSTATQNTAVGYGAGTDLTTAVNSTFLGADAGANVTTGNKNTMVGDGAGVHITTGASNTVLGRYSGNAGGLDIRTKSNNIVCSDGDGNPRFGYADWDNNTYQYFRSDNPTGGQVAAKIVNSGSSNPYGLALRFDNAAPDNNTQYFLDCSDTSATRARIESDGDFQSADNSYGSLSDEKLKENIADASSQWDDIKAVRVRKYSMKEHNSDTANRIGVIAQELEAAGMNGLVKETPDLDTNSDNGIVELGTTTKSVKYSILYMKAVKALQEAMTRIETLETENTAIKARLDALEAE